MHYFNIDGIVAVTSTNLPSDVLTQGKLALKLRNTAARAVA